MNVAPHLWEAIYPLPYAACLAGLKLQTARRWMRGYEFRHNGRTRQSAPVLHSDAPDASVNRDVTFEELLTLRLVRAFREEAGLGLPTIKAAARVAALRYGIGNPFVTRAFRSDGRKVFLDLQAQRGIHGQQRLLVEALTGQQQFHDIVEPSLFKNVVFVGDEPSEWRPVGLERSVVIRPDRAFGAPHIDGTGVRTDVLADAFVAEGGGPSAMASVAAWFELDERQVCDAVEAEAAWRFKKA